MTKVTILSGSSRPGNNTLRVSRAIHRICLEHGATAEIIDFKEYDIPFPNGGHVDPNNLTPFQHKLISHWRTSNLVFVVSPEYNWFPSAEIINMIHQLGTHTFKDLFEHKVFATTGVSTGRGGRMPAVQLSYVLDKIINVFETDSITCPKKFESQFSTRTLDENGNSLGNAEYDLGITKYVDYSLQLAKRWSAEDVGS
jgi:chromate reductase